MAEINRESQEFAEIMAQVNREMNKYGELHVSTAERLRDAEMKAKFGIDNFSKSTSMGADALSKFGEAAFSSGKALLDGKKGASALNSTLDQLTDSVKMAAIALTFLVPGGPLIKGLVAGIGLLTVSVLEAGKKYTQAANTMSDQLYKGYQDLAQSGAAASDGMTGLFNDAKKLGLSMNDIGQYTELIAANSKDLALFSGSVFEGRKRFADMGKAMEPFRESLMNAGMTQEQINAGSMQYLRLQTRIGQSQNKTTTELADGARKYLLEQDALAKITGVNRKEQEDIMESARSEQRFRAKLDAMRASGDEKQIAAADRLEKANIILSSQSKETGQAFRDIQSGAITTEAAQKGLISSQGELMRSSEKLRDGQITELQLVNNVGKSIGAFNKSMNMTAQLGVLNDFALDYAQTQNLAIFTQKDLTEQQRLAEEELKKQGGKGGKAADAAVQAQTDLVRMQQKGNEAVERFVFAGIVPATNAMTVLVEKTTLAAGAMAKMFGLAGQEQGGTAELGSGGTIDGATPDTAAISASGGVLGQLAAEDKMKKLPEYEKTLAEIERYQKLFNDGNKLNEKQLEGFKKRSEIAAQAVADYNKKFAKPAAAGGGAAPAATGGGAAAGGGAAPAAPAARSMGGGTKVQSSREQLEQSGLKVKKGDVQKEGATIDTRVLDLAKQVQSNLPGFAYFSGFNDTFHNENSPKSLHTKGLAMDFALQKTPTVKEGQGIVNYLKSLGATEAIDEYNNPSKKSTAGHMHASLPELADGGIVKASDGGTPAIIGEGGQDEAVIPLKNGALPVSISLKDAISSSPTMGGYNEYAGLNMGPVTTDLDAVKNIAAAAGAFDKASQTITDPATWKQVLSSGLATNFQLGAATIGTKGIGILGDDIAERLKEIREQSGADSNAALQQVTAEFKAIMTQYSEELAELARRQNEAAMGGGLSELLSELVSATKSGVDVQQKILAANY